MTQTSTALGGRIVVGVDGSPSSQDAVRWAAGQAKLTGAEIEAVTAWEYPTSFGWVPPYPPDFDPAADATRAQSEAIDEVLGKSSEIPVRRTVVEGHAAPALVDASKDASLLVVGSRGHGEFVGMLIGSVSEYCVAKAHCPVVVMRGPEDS